MLTGPAGHRFVAFLSYRRDDSSGYAGRLHDALADRFGRERVFMDIDTIPAGADFAERIAVAVERSDALLVLIGPRWLTASREAGVRRLDDPADYVRLEIEAALRRDALVIPILVQGARMPRSSDLPASLAALAHRNAHELSDGRWAGDVEKLMETLAELPAGRDSQSVVSRDTVERSRETPQHEVVACPQCHEENPARARFCWSCAAPLAAQPASGHVRKTVTIVRAGIVLATTSRDVIDPESLQAAADQYLAGARTAVERHGGTFQTLGGDAIVAVFGVPTLHEDDPVRAVRAAMAMRVAIQDVGSQLQGDRGVSVAVRMGVDTGAVMTGDPGSGGGLVTGDAVTMAARLQQAAANGEILLGESTWRLVRDAVTVEQAPGDPTTGAAYRLMTVEDRAAGHARRLERPIVGREHELALVRSLFERSVREHSPQLVTLLGTAGVGKSRLVAAFLAALGDSAAVFQGRCLPYGESITYWPVREIIYAAAGITEIDATAVAIERIAALVQGEPEHDTLVLRLAAVAGLNTAGSGQEELFWAVRRLLERLARAGPAVLLIEDIHWASSTLLDLIEHVVDLARDVPLLLLCTARPELLADRPGWGGGKFNATTLLLEPLPIDVAELLIGGLPGGAALPAPLRQRILDAAEGNPLFVEEMLGILIDEGRLVLQDDAWRAHGNIDSVLVPPTVHALLASRLERLPADERTVAEVGSVVGRSFEQAAVAEIAPAEVRGRLARTLVALVRKELLRAEQAELTPGDAYRFRHILIRDAAYEALPKAERAELHERFADWLERTAGESLTEFEEIIGYHLEQAYRYRLELAPAGDRERELARRAGERLISAGRRAFAMSDYSATLNLLGRASTILEPADPIRLAMLPELGRALGENGRTDDARACFAELVEQLRGSADEHAVARARVTQYLSGNVGRPVSMDEYRSVADESIAVFERYDDNQGLAYAWRIHASVFSGDGQLQEEERSLVRALGYAQRAGDRHEESNIAFDLGFDLTQGRTPIPEGIRRCEETIAAAPDDRSIEMAMSHPLAHLRARLGEFEAARRHAARTLEIATESGRLSLAAVLSELEWDVETLAGNHEVAERVIADGCARLTAIWGPDALHEGFLALSQVALGHPVDIDRLERITAEARGWVRALPESAIAVVHLAAGRIGDAERYARSAVDILATTELITWHAEAEMVLGDVLRTEGRREDADAAYERALDLFRQKGNLIGTRMAEARLAGGV